MAKSHSKRKTRSDKFPLTLHPTGQYCKKISGKLYYFGSDKRTASERYLEQAAFLHAGKRPRPNTVNKKVPLPIVQKQVGHRSLKTTSVYLAPSAETMAEAYDGSRSPQIKNDTS